MIDKPLSVAGNGLTLVALPYVQWRYPASEFTILRNSTADLIINLALCDFIYCSAGIGHFVHVLSIGKLQYLHAIHRWLPLQRRIPRWGHNVLLAGGRQARGLHCRVLHYGSDRHINLLETTAAWKTETGGFLQALVGVPGHIGDLGYQLPLYDWGHPGSDGRVPLEWDGLWLWWRLW